MRQQDQRKVQREKAYEKYQSMERTPCRDSAILFFFTVECDKDERLLTVRRRECSPEFNSQYYIDELRRRHPRISTCVKFTVYRRLKGHKTSRNIMAKPMLLPHYETRPLSWMEKAKVVHRAHARTPTLFQWNLKWVSIKHNLRYHLS